MCMSAEVAGWVLPKVLLVCTHLAPRWTSFVFSSVDTSATSCVMPIWLLLPQLHSFRVCYLHTLVSMLSAWATNCFLFLLLCLRSCGHFVSILCLGVATYYAGATDWVLPILLLHHAHFAPRHILPWYGHLCWCY